MRRMGTSPVMRCIENIPLSHHQFFSISFNAYKVFNASSGAQ
jgi:hypothetical protein